MNHTFAEMNPTDPNPFHTILSVQAATLSLTNTELASVSAKTRTTPATTLPLDEGIRVRGATNQCEEEEADRRVL